MDDAARLAQHALYVQAAAPGEGAPMLDPALANQLLTEIYERGRLPVFETGVDEGFDAAMVAYVEHGRAL